MSTAKRSIPPPAPKGNQYHSKGEAARRNMRFVRLSDAELATVERAMGAGTLSAWLRKVVVGVAERKLAQRNARLAEDTHWYASGVAQSDSKGGTEV